MRKRNPHYLNRPTPSRHLRQLARQSGLSMQHSPARAVASTSCQRHWSSTILLPLDERHDLKTESKNLIRPILNFFLFSSHFTDQVTTAMIRRKVTWMSSRSHPHPNRVLTATPTPHRDAGLDRARLIWLTRGGSNWKTCKREMIIFSWGWSRRESR